MTNDIHSNGTMKTRPSPLTIRLDEATRGRMRSVASRLRLSHSALIRLGLLQTLEEMEAGHVRVPTEHTTEHTTRTS